ncbi:uncharacterized protein Dwil_GK28268 [Drosophila willistoni]|uniref:Uncharacterized protein n=1 Tax=Drosophila willistoni TaxID=7260 RepID=A0A0Q9WV79_DROWI|nr:uncharacterized protein Dwil_GK28268 [Drosophila willistoni]
MRSSGIPILQLNEMANIDVKHYYNSEVLAMLCINEFADTMLLTTLAQTLRQMAWGRIIIWINIPHPNELSQLLFIIGNQATKHKFINLLAIHQTNDTVIGFHLKPFPVAHFERVDNILDPKKEFFINHQINFRGKSATLLSNNNSARLFGSRLLGSRSKIFTDFSEKFIREFALQTNLSLRVKNISIIDTVTEQFDFLNDFSFFNLKNVDYSMQIFDTTMMIVVPCGKEIFNMLDIYKSTGLIITTFFSSNLTAMMTKRPELNHIRNFKELRESNLTVVFDHLSKSIIERQMNPNFFRNTVPNSVFVSLDTKLDMILSNW